MIEAGNARMPYMAPRSAPGEPTCQSGAMAGLFASNDAVAGCDPRIAIRSSPVPTQGGVERGRGSVSTAGCHTPGSGRASLEGRTRRRGRGPSSASSFVRAALPRRSRGESATAFATCEN